MRRTANSRNLKSIILKEIRSLLREDEVDDRIQEQFGHFKVGDVLKKVDLEWDEETEVKVVQVIAYQGKTYGYGLLEHGDFSIFVLDERADSTASHELKK